MGSQAEQLWSQAQCHIAAKQAAPARAALEALLSAEPDHTLARLALCNLAWRQDRVREAAGHALHAARHPPDYPELIGETVAVLLRVGETVAARQCLGHAALGKAASDALLIHLADHWHVLGEHAEALARADRARELGFDGDGVRFRRGRELACLGRMREAEPELELGFLLGPTHGEIALELGRLRTQTRERNHLNTLANGLKSVARGSCDHAALEFALYKELEDVGRHDDAWQALVRANGIMAQRRRCDVERMRRWFDLCMALCTTDTLVPAQRAYDGPQPIFVIGLPHSGTREVARLLGRHPDATDAGELGDFEQQLRWAADHRTTQDDRFLEGVPALDFGEIGQRYLAQTQWRARGRRHFIDSRPDNWMYAGLIHAALPHARILHVSCDAMDACFAQYRRFAGDTHEYAHDLSALGTHYRLYRRLMDHWRARMPNAILEIPRELLASGPETILREVFAGEAAVAGESPLVGDKPSAGMEGPGRDHKEPSLLAAGEWRRYATHLGDFAAALNAAGGDSP
ncbi:MAG TPA: sulfotransferase [Rhodanobacteraceae bacterium]|nr:sulfotransferase [Rhodanobacteraceae bacterium]